MAPKTESKAIFVDVHSPQEPEHDSEAEPETEPPVKVKQVLSEERLAKLAFARTKALAACKLKAEKAKSERMLVRTQKAEMEAMRKAEIDAFLAKKKKDAAKSEICPDPETLAETLKDPAPTAKSKQTSLTPEMKLYLRNKSMKYAQQAVLAMHAQAAAPPTAAVTPASDVKVLARGRVQQYLTEETLSQAMSQIFPSGRYA